MKTRNMIFVFGAALMVSFGVFSSTKLAMKASAEGVTDLGTFRFSEANSDSFLTSIYGINSVKNSAPTGWDSPKFTPVGDNSGTFINDVRVGEEIKKLDASTYYIAVTGAQVGSIATVKGKWANDTYSFTVKPFSVKWTGEKWVNSPILEAYDTITLRDTCFDDKDKETFDSTGLVPGEWNTYAPSSENTRNSFAFKFLYESYQTVDKGLDIKIGGSGKWDEGHFYHLFLDNAWGLPQGAIWFYERNNGSVIYTSNEIRANLQPGTRHTIEFGSIYIKESIDTFDYVKFDGETLWSKINEPASHVRSTKVSYAFSGTNIFFGSTPTATENDQMLQFNHFDSNTNGIFLNGTINSIPGNWDVKGAPASKYNALINGKPMYAYGVSHPMTKCTEIESGAYYLDLGLTGHTFVEGDVITLSDEFRFYYSGTAYKASFNPISILYSKNQYSEIDNINTYLSNKIASHCDLDIYDADKVILIEELVNEASNNLPTAKSMKALWDMYYDYIAQLDEIPINEEKAREILENAKAEAKLELSALLDNYSEEQLPTVQEYINAAIQQIDDESTDTISKVNEIVADTLELLEPIPTKLQVIEEKIMASDTLLDEYLASYDVFTTTDLCAVGDLEFKAEGTYGSGAHDDITSIINTSSDNEKGNMIFQFNYSSDNPAAGKYDNTQVFIRMRSNDDDNTYRFDIATDTGEENIGVGLAVLKNGHAEGRKLLPLNLTADKTYTMKCGAIDLDGFERTLLFIEVSYENDSHEVETKLLKSIVDSLPDSKPTIKIMDSFVNDPYTAKFSAIEEGTTKGDYASLLGRLILDESSDENGLYVTLRDNKIDVGEELYPLESGAFKVNGEELASSRAVTRIQKVSENKYVISISAKDFEFTDGTVISIGGLFAAMSSTTVEKSVYRLFDTSFTYIEADKSWSQESPSDPEVIRYEAEETIKYYVDKSNYSEAHAQEVEQIIEIYVARVKVAAINDVPSIVEEALRAIDAIPSLFDEYKQAAKDELTNYRSPDLYRAEEKTELSRILSDAFTKIDNSADKDSVDLVVLQAKADIDDLKTAAERDAEDLAEAKQSAKRDIDDFFSKVEAKRYSNENVAVLTDLYYTALDDVDSATSIEGVNTVVSNFKEAIKAVKTKDGSKFDGDKYIEKKSSGCGGSVEAVSMLSFVALFGAAILLIIKKLKEN